MSYQAQYQPIMSESAPPPAPYQQQQPPSSPYQQPYQQTTGYTTLPSAGAPFFVSASITQQMEENKVPESTFHWRELARFDTFQGVAILKFFYIFFLVLLTIYLMFAVISAGAILGSPGLIIGIIIAVFSFPLLVCAIRLGFEVTLSILVLPKLLIEISKKQNNADAKAFANV